MRIGKNQIYVLQEMKRIMEKCDCELIYSANLIINLYYPNFFNDDFDDDFDDWRFHKTPEYKSARTNLSRAMRRLMDGDARRAMGEAASRKARSKFSIEKHVARMLDLYDAVLQRRSGADSPTTETT